MKCFKCNIEFTCSGNDSCWCYGLPKLKSEELNAQCLCNDCLIEKMAHSINSGESQLSKTERAEIAKLGVPDKASENIDYYINANGLFVFLKWYHLRRGQCCENNCQHCPYN
jgi:Tfp pilus assembly protein PilX